VAVGELQGAPLDLVIDDASHRLRETISSFEVLFPLLRPGGLFLLEDWDWQHLIAREVARAGPDEAPKADPGRRLSDLLTSLEKSNQTVGSGQQGEAGETRDREAATLVRPLTAFVQQLVLARAQSGEAIAEVVVGAFWVRIRRGPAVLRPLQFGLADWCTDYFGEVAGELG
jgi:hypothetical protein